MYLLCFKLAVSEYTVVLENMGVCISPITPFAQSPTTFNTLKKWMQFWGLFTLHRGKNICEMMHFSSALRLESTSQLQNLKVPQRDFSPLLFETVVFSSFFLNKSPTQIYPQKFHLKLDERSVELSVCKVNEKHPESGQIYREHHWSWPVAEYDLRDKRRGDEGAGTYSLSAAYRRGQRSPAGCLWKTEGQRKGEK